MIAYLSMTIFFWIAVAALVVTAFLAWEIHHTLEKLRWQQGQMIVLLFEIRDGTHGTSMTLAQWEHISHDHLDLR